MHRYCDKDVLTEQKNRQNEGSEAPNKPFLALRFRTGFIFTRFICALPFDGSQPQERDRRTERCTVQCVPPHAQRIRAAHSHPRGGSSPLARSGKDLRQARQIHCQDYDIRVHATTAHASRVQSIPQSSWSGMLLLYLPADTQNTLTTDPCLSLLKPNPILSAHCQCSTNWE